jgi:hypothetical protein
MRCAGRAFRRCSLASRRKATGWICAYSPPISDRARKFCQQMNRFTRAYSITKKISPRSSNASWIAAMCGSFNREAQSASRHNRSREFSFTQRCAATRFSATVRRNLVSRARYTSPMPPAPRRASTAKRPTVFPIRVRATAASGGVDCVLTRFLVLDRMLLVTDRFSRRNDSVSGLLDPLVLSEWYA